MALLERHAIALSHDPYSIAYGGRLATVWAAVRPDQTSTGGSALAAHVSARERQGASRR